MNWNVVSLLCVVGIFAGCSGIPTKQIGDRPPNIVMIIGDDHGYEYFGFMGSENVQTPNLDEIAQEGIVFPQTHTTASVCRPSLATLLTGLYPLQFDHLLRTRERKSSRQFYREMLNQAAAGNDHRATAYPISRFSTLPQYLSREGYASFEGGKYWEGPFWLAGFTDGMTRHAGPAEVAKYGAINAMAGGAGLALGRDSNNAVYEFIDAYKDQPFFVWYAPMLPHTPHDPSDEFMEMYAGMGLTRATQRYYANITRFDTRVGELVAYLDSQGLRENTLLLYLVDNGYEQNPDDYFKPMGQRRGKGSLHEMGFRTPLIFRWPGVIPAGTTNQGLVSTVDIFPTVLDFAGAEIPEGLPGRSIKESILRNLPTEREILFGSMSQLRTGPDNPATGTNPYANEEVGYYLTTSQWHFIYYEDRDSVALYNRLEDTHQENNLADENPELVDHFRKKIENWKARQLEDMNDYQ